MRRYQKDFKEIQCLQSEFIITCNEVTSSKDPKKAKKGC
jgi:hypothetical protein